MGHGRVSASFGNDAAGIRKGQVGEGLLVIRVIQIQAFVQGDGAFMELYLRILGAIKEAGRIQRLRVEKRKSVGAKIIAVVILSMLMILLTGCNGADKKASTISTAAAVAEAAETAEPLNVVGITQHVEGKVYTFDKVQFTRDYTG